MVILICVFEFLKFKIKYKLDIISVEEFKKMQNYEREKFIEMIEQLKEIGVNFVICQWGFDDEVNYLFFQNKLLVVWWVGGLEIELIVIVINGCIVLCFEDFKFEKLGIVGVVREMIFGMMCEKMLVIEECVNIWVVIVFVCGSNKMVSRIYLCYYCSN